MHQRIRGDGRRCGDDEPGGHSACAGQVAKASFAGMRLLNRLDGRVPVWPMDGRPKEGSLVVEIYTRAFIRLAGAERTQGRDAGAAQ